MVINVDLGENARFVELYIFSLTMPYHESRPNTLKEGERIACDELLMVKEAAVQLKVAPIWIHECTRLRNGSVCKLSGHVRILGGYCSLGRRAERMRCGVDCCITWRRGVLIYAAIHAFRNASRSLVVRHPCQPYRIQ